MCKAVEIPFVGMTSSAGVLCDETAHDVVGDAHQIFLLVFAFEKLLAKAVDGFALLVHDVVVFEDVFAVREVLAFNPLLRVFDLLRDEARFDGNAFFHSERCMIPEMRSAAKIRIRSSSSET